MSRNMYARRRVNTREEQMLLHDLLAESFVYISVCVCVSVLYSLDSVLGQQGHLGATKVRDTNFVLGQSQPRVLIIDNNSNLSTKVISALNP